MTTQDRIGAQAWVGYFMWIVGLPLVIYGAASLGGAVTVVVVGALLLWGGSRLTARPSRQELLLASILDAVEAIAEDIEGDGADERS